MSDRARLAAVLVEFVAAGSGFEYAAADALIAAGVRPAPPEPEPGLQPDGSAIDAAGQRWQWTGQEWVRDQ